MLKKMPWRKWKLGPLRPRRRQRREQLPRLVREAESRPAVVAIIDMSFDGATSNVRAIKAMISRHNEELMFGEVTPEQVAARTPEESGCLIEEVD